MESCDTAKVNISTNAHFNSAIFMSIQVFGSWPNYTAIFSPTEAKVKIKKVIYRATPAFEVQPFSVPIVVGLSCVPPHKRPAALELLPMQVMQIV
jgi:hypothetical protein